MSTLRKLDGELAALLTILGLLLVAEAALRINGARLSGDVAHLEQVSDIAATVSSSPGSAVLLWGNSLIGAGVDPEGLGTRLSGLLEDTVAVGLVRPDGTGPLEWRYLFRRSVANRDLALDVLVLGVGPGHLIDRSPRQALDRLAAHHVDRRDIPLLFESDVVELEGRASFLVSRLSAAHNLRERIRDRALDRLVPGYRNVAPALLAPPPTAESGGPADRTYVQLGRLLDDISGADIPLVALLMPAPETWALEPEVMAELSRVGAVVLDVRESVNLPPERFPDGEHLDVSGRDAFTTALAPELARLMTELGG